MKGSKWMAMNPVSLMAKIERLPKIMINKKDVFQSYMLGGEAGELLVVRTYLNGQRTNLMHARQGDGKETIFAVPDAIAEVFKSKANASLEKTIYSISDNGVIWEVEVFKIINNDKGSFVLSPILMPDGSYREYSLIIIKVEDGQVGDGETFYYPEWLDSEVLRLTSLTSEKISQMTRTQITDLLPM